jgi:hypothetical protein
MVTVEVAPAALEAAFSVSTLLPVPGDAMPAGAKLALTPPGSPLADKLTADLNPLSAAVAIVMVVELPALTVALVAPGVRLKLGATTVNATGVVRVIPPPVPVMVTVELPAAAFEAAVNVTVTGAELVTLAEEN